MKSINRIEYIVGGILVFLFLIWSYNTCSSSSEKYQPKEPPVQEQPEPKPAEPAAQNPPTTTTQPAPAPVQSAPAATALPIIYVFTDKLKMRDKPFLSGSVVLAELSKNAELYFLNNKTDYTDKITLGTVTYNEPWIEVQTKDRQFRGWVYGGGVRFYKN
jgi:hypothetical protein